MKYSNESPKKIKKNQIKIVRKLEDENGKTLQEIIIEILKLKI